MNDKISIKDRAALKEFNSYMIEKPLNVFKKVPKCKQEEVEKTAKSNVIQARMVFASEQIERLNSPLRDKDLIDLKINFRNYHRQLLFHKSRLNLVVNGKDVVDESGTKVQKHQIAYLVDKLSGDLELMRKDLSLYGLKESEVLYTE